MSEFGGDGEAPERLVWTRPVLEDLGELGSVLAGLSAFSDAANSSFQASS